MLPRSCLRFADSKSNSSTRLPRSTTTRVSSGWVASMSILLAIKQSHEGRPAVRSAPYRRWGTGASPISGEGNGLDTPNAAGIARKAGKRAARVQPNLDFPLEDLREDLRLEHELQTAMRATAEPSQFLSIAHGIGATRAPAACGAAGIRVTHGVPAVLFLKGIGFARWSAFVCAFRRRR